MIKPKTLPSKKPAMVSKSVIPICFIRPVWKRVPSIFNDLDGDEKINEFIIPVAANISHKAKNTTKIEICNRVFKRFLLLSFFK